MTQFDTGSTKQIRPSSNVYSLLVFVAFIALAVAVGFVWMQNIDLVGGDNPFKLI